MPSPNQLASVPPGEELVGHGQKLFARSKTARSLVEVRWARSNDLYDSIFPRDKKAVSDVLFGQFRLFIPKTYNTVSRIHVDVMETFYYDQEELVDVAQRPNIPEKNREVTKAVLNYYLRGHPINYYQELSEATQDGLKNKVGVFKVWPKFRLATKETKISKLDESTGKVVEMVDKTTVLKQFEPQLSAIPPEDLFISPAATWKDYWKYPMVYHFTRTRQQLLEMGFDKEAVMKASASIDSGTDLVKEQRNRSGYGSPFSASPAEKSSQDLIHGYEFWDFMDLNQDGYEESVTYTLLGTSLAPEVVAMKPRANTLPYKFSDFECVRPPFVIGQPFPEAHKAYGKDLPEFTEGLQMETNAVRNQDREAAALAIRKPIVVSKDAEINMQALVNRKIGAVITGEDVGPDKVRELQISSPIINTAQISRTIAQDYDEATSITPTQLGLGGDEQTATGATVTQENANKKIAGVVRNYRHTLIIPAMQLVLRLAQAYESDEKVRQITGEVLGWELPNDGTPSWAIIQGDYELSVDTTLNKQLQTNKYLLIADRMNQANLGLGQLLSQGMVKAGEIKFANPMWALDQLLKVLKVRNTDSAKIQAQEPPPPQPGAGGAKGVASQPGVNANPSVSTQQFNPEAFLAEISGSR